MDREQLVEEIKKILADVAAAERTALDAIDVVREVDPKEATKLLEHPDYLKLLTSRNRLETQLKELEENSEDS